MRCFGVLICGVLLSVQGFAFKGVADKVGSGAARLTKRLLGNQQLVKQVAETHGVSPLAINSRNIVQAVVSAAMGGALLLGVTATSDADLEKRAKEMDKKVSSAKVVELGEGIELDYSASIFANYADYDDSKPDTLDLGIGSDLTLRRGLSELALTGSVKSKNTKPVGVEDYSGAEDYVGRIMATQGIRVAEDSIWYPLLYADGGGAHYGDNKRQVDATGGIGVKVGTELFGKKLEMQLRGGFGGLWDAKYRADSDDFADLEGETVATFGVMVKTGWISMGDFVDAEEGSILYYLPMVPNATTSYFQYHPVGDGEFSDATRRLESTINITQGLGVSIEWNKKEDEAAHKAIFAKFTHNLF